MLGYDSPADVVGLDLVALTAPESMPGVLENIASGIEEPREFIALRKDGTRFPIEIVGATGQLHGKDVRFLVMRDLTQRKRLEEERLEIERALAEGQRQESLAVLAGGVAHDFNNLLVAILGNAASPPKSSRTTPRYGRSSRTSTPPAGVRPTSPARCLLTPAADGSPSNP